MEASERELYHMWKQQNNIAKQFITGAIYENVDNRVDIITPK